MESADPRKFAGELGDLLLQVVFHADPRRRGRALHDFRCDRVHPFEDGPAPPARFRRRHREKLRRRPQELGADQSRGTRRRTSRVAYQRKARTTEAESAPESVLDGVPRSLPAVLEAYQLTRRASHVQVSTGITLKKYLRSWMKKHELCAELGIAAKSVTSGKRPKASSKLEEEVGDLLFTAVNIARFSGVDPEIALKKANRKFKQRFNSMQNPPRPATVSALPTSRATEWNSCGTNRKSPNRKSCPMRTEHRCRKIFLPHKARQLRCPYDRPIRRPEHRTEIRHCTTLAEYEECVRIEHITWGPELAEPSGMFVVAHHTGGQVLGAFDGPKMVGFTLAIAGRAPGRKAVPAFAPDGGAARVSRPRHRAAVKTLSTQRRAAAPDQPRRMDLRSPRIEKRLLQSGPARRHRTPLHPRLLRHHEQRPAFGPAHRSSRRRMVARFAARAGSSGGNRSADERPCRTISSPLEHRRTQSQRRSRRAAHSNRASRAIPPRVRERPGQPLPSSRVSRASIIFSSRRQPSRACVFRIFRRRLIRAELLHRPLAMVLAFPAP